jgi:hypothetical protein
MLIQDDEPRMLTLSIDDVMRPSAVEKLRHDLEIARDFFFDQQFEDISQRLRKFTNVVVSKKYFCHRLSRPGLNVTFASRSRRYDSLPTRATQMPPNDLAANLNFGVMRASARPPQVATLEQRPNFRKIARELDLKKEASRMGIEVVPYTPDRVDAVLAFNKRMADGNTGWGWYEHSEDEWLPKRPGVEVWREHYVAVEDGTDVRGAYALKPQPWFINGEQVLVTDWQGPVSEGLLSRKYNTLGLRLLREMLKRYPLLYSWGHGGDEASMLQMLKSLKWQIHPTPFCLRVVKPFRFLRKNRYLRGTPNRRLGLDALAMTGLGWIGLKLMHAALSLKGLATRRAEAEHVEDFGSWADALWEKCRGDYKVIGLRDATTMNALLPREGWPHCFRLRVRRGAEDLGWVVVMDNQLSDDARFGELRVGSVVDCLAAPDDAAAVIGAANRFLVDRGVDMIASNQAHPIWAEAFAKNGYVVLPGRRYFAASPELQKVLAPFDENQTGLHLTNLDGHGPHGF